MWSDHFPYTSRCGTVGRHCFSCPTPFHWHPTWLSGLEGGLGRMLTNGLWHLLWPAGSWRPRQYNSDLRNHRGSSDGLELWGTLTPGTLCQEMAGLPWELSPGPDPQGLRGRGQLPQSQWKLCMLQTLCHNPGGRQRTGHGSFCLSEDEETSNLALATLNGNWELLNQRF